MGERSHNVRGPLLPPRTFRSVLVLTTTCQRCGSEHPTCELIDIAGQALCADCADACRNRPFPKWVIASLAAILVLVIVSMVWNLRFFQGYFEQKAFWAAVGHNDLAGAAKYGSAAVAHVPESKELQEWSGYFQGLAYVGQEKSSEAGACFARCDGLPRTLGVVFWRQQAAAGAAYQRKDYDAFLQATEAMAIEQPMDPSAQAHVAGALACLYAVSGDESLRRRAEAKLEEAKRMDRGTLKAGGYEERIRYRLQTREIIDAKEFRRRFPNGWKPSGEPKP